MQEHHAAKHHAALLAPGNHVHRLLHIIAREEQATQCAADQCFDIRAFVTTGTHITRNPVGQILVGGKVSGMILGEVTDLGFLGPLDGAGRRGEFALQQFEQCGFTNTVFTDDGDFFTTVDVE